MIKLPPQIKKDLSMVCDVADDLKMLLYVVGGFPRDYISGKGITDETDIDVTEYYGNGFDLAFFVAAKYNLADPIVYDSSGTALVIMPSGRDIEFHNAYHNIYHIIDQLYMMGIEPSPINKDIYSRDFTINTLLYNPEDGEVLDVTKHGIDDIENKVLRTPLPAAKSLEINPKIILRGIRFKLELGLKEDPEYTKQVPNYIPSLIEFLQKNKDSKMVQRNVKKTLAINAEAAVDEYIKLGILSYLPKELEIDKVMRKKLFGTTITPVSMEREVQAQSKMMQRMIEEQEKHKTYMRRKKREDKIQKAKMLKIIDRAKSGYYHDNAEQEFLKNKAIDKRRRLFKYITQKDY